MKMITEEGLTRLRAELENLPAVIADARRETKDRRRLRDLSVRAAADEMGVPATTLTRFENGEGTPHVNTLLAILRWIVAPNSSEEDR